MHSFYWLILLLGSPIIFQAQTPCTLDINFGTGGKIIADGGRMAEHIILLPDGRTLVACNPFGNGSVYIRRYLPNGLPDTGYGTSGKCTLTVAEVATRISDMKWSGQDLVVCGRTTTNIGGTNTYPFVARVDSNGQLLSSFGTAGIKKLNTSYYYAEALELDSDGSIVVCGTANNPEKVFVAKMNTNGVYDMSFDGDGIMTFETGNTDHWYEVKDLVIDQQHRIVLGGKKYRANNGSTIPLFWHILVARITTNGTLDATFATGGIGTYNSSSSYLHETKNLHIAPNQEYVICGDTYNGNDYDYTVLKLKQDGTVQTSFGTSGWVHHDLDMNQEMENPLNSAVLPDGRILMTGNQGSGDTVYFTLLMMRPDGQRDPDFAPNGVFKHIFGSNNNSSSSGLALNHTGEFVLGGYTRTCTGGVCGPLYMALAKYKHTLAPSGSSNIAERETVQLYPNPANDVLQIDVPEPGNIQVFDLHGRLWYQGPTTLHQKISVQHYPSGVYQLRYQTAKGTVHRLFVKD